MMYLLLDTKVHWTNLTNDKKVKIVGDFAFQTETELEWLRSEVLTFGVKTRMHNNRTECDNKATYREMKEKNVDKYGDLTMKFSKCSSCGNQTYSL